MFDFARILKLIETGAGADGAAAGSARWLGESWQSPGAFSSSLLAFHAGRSAPPPKSRAGESYDFVHDLLARAPDADAPALRVLQRQGTWQSITYGDLTRRSAKRAADLRAGGVQPGSALCLCYEPGVELLVTMMAALRLGAVITILPLGGPRFIAHRLAACAPDLIAAEAHQAPLFPGWQDKLLREGIGGAPVNESFTYAAGSLVGRCLSPRHHLEEGPVPLWADDAYVGALRDGLLTFLLRPGDALAAPGTPLAQSWPALPLLALARGATLVHLEPQAIERDPGQLARLPLRSLGVTPWLRDLLLRTRPGPLRGVEHWFRNPEEGFDPVTWQSFIAACGLRETPHSNVLLEASLGGAALSSLRRRGQVHAEVAPAAGRAFALLDVNLSGQESATDHGVLQPLPPPPLPKAKRPAGVTILARSGPAEYLHGGPREPRRDGRVYPTGEVVAVVEELPGVAGCSVVALPAGSEVAATRFLLLVFVGAEPPDAGGPKPDAIRALLERLLGPFALPDRIELVPLFPRRDEAGATDGEWCRGQYLRGALHRKPAERAFVLLTALRASTVEKKARRQAARAEV